MRTTSPGAVWLRLLLAIGLAGVALAAGPGCVPPIGTGPLPLPMIGDEGATVRAALRYAGSPERHGLQVTAESSFAVSEWFTADLGGLYVALRDPGLYPWQADEPSEYKHSGFPFIRPTVHLGPVTIALTASALFALGPQAGLAFGYGALSVGYADPEWSAYAGIAGHGFTYLTQRGQPEGGTWQVAVGGQRRWIVAGGLLLGVDAELGYVEQAYNEHGPIDERTRRAFTGTIGLELGWATVPEPPPPPRTDN